MRNRLDVKVVETEKQIVKMVILIKACRENDERYNSLYVHMCTKLLVIL
jgi:hypothetical protein